MATEVEQPITDGRSARRDRNKLAVLDAALELFTEGFVDPDPEMVAARCGLSPRSVYRYFEDHEALLRAAIDRNLEVVLPLYLLHAIGEGPLDDRIERFVSGRLRLYEAIAATSRAARVRAATSEIVADQVELTRQALRGQVEKHFAPELRSLPAKQRRLRTATLDALCQIETLDQYRLHQSLSLKETHLLLVEALHTFLDPVPTANPTRTTNLTRTTTKDDTP